MTNRNTYRPAPLPERVFAFRMLVEEVADQAGDRQLALAVGDQWPQALRRLERATGLYFPASERPNRIRTGLHWLIATNRVPLQSVPDLGRMLVDAGVKIPGGVHSVTTMTNPTDADDSAGFITGIDVNAMWPNAAQVVELGTGRPVLVDAPEPELYLHPGFFLLEPDPDWPVPFRGLPPGRWVPSPLVRLLAERHHSPLRARQGLIWPEHRRWLRTFAQTALRARNDLVGPDPISRAAATALKAIINPAVDGVLRSDMNRTAWHRPDWAEQVRAMGAANMWRHLYRAAVLPTAQATDAAYYVVDRLGARPPIPDSKSGPTYSHQPGRFKVHRTVPYTLKMRAAASNGQAHQFQTLVLQAHREAAYA